MIKEMLLTNVLIDDEYAERLVTRLDVEFFLGKDVTQMTPEEFFFQAVEVLECGYLDASSDVDADEADIGWYNPEV